MSDEVKLEPGVAQQGTVENSIFVQAGGISQVAAEPEQSGLCGTGTGASHFDEAVIELETLCSLCAAAKHYGG